MKEHEKIEQEIDTKKKAEETLHNNAPEQLISTQENAKKHEADINKQDEQQSIPTTQQEGVSSSVAESVRSHTDTVTQQATTSEQGAQQQEGSSYTRARTYDRARPRAVEYRRTTSEKRPHTSSYQQRPYVERAETVQPTLEEMTASELNTQARRLGIVGAELMKKADLLEKIRYVESHPELEMKVSGVLEKLPDGFGFLRSAHYDYVSGPDDVYVSPSQIRRFGLRTGDLVDGIIRKPKDNEKYFALLKIDKINGADSTAVLDRPQFERLTPHHPTKKFNLEWKVEDISTRLMDMFTPIGKGQRGLIVAPPKVGKTLLLKEVAQVLVANHPESHLIVLLIDERPEEVADMRRTLRGTAAEVIASTFDEASMRHVQVADIVLERAKRMVEMGSDVIILLDSITRLARAFNTEAPASGKILTGGIDASALQHPKRFFGAARATEEAGSLTILATALVETGSRADEVIYEEFKGTGNMEMHMTRKLSNKRIFPAFDLQVSGTRREDLLLGEDLNKVWVLQKFLSTMNINEGMEFLIDKMKRFETNREFLDSINKRSVEITTASNTNGSSKDRQ